MVNFKEASVCERAFYLCSSLYDLKLKSELFEKQTNLNALPVTNIPLQYCIINRRVTSAQCRQQTTTFPHVSHAPSR